MSAIFASPPRKKRNRGGWRPRGSFQDVYNERANYEDPFRVLKSKTVAIQGPPSVVFLRTLGFVFTPLLPGRSEEKTSCFNTQAQPPARRNLREPPRPGKYRAVRIPPLTSSRYIHPAVKITVAHDSTKNEVKQALDRSLDDIFTGSINLPVKLVKQGRSWNSDTLTFSLLAKMGPMGLMSTPITGTVLVTDHDLTIDVNLGILERMIPADKARQIVSTRLKGLLK